MDAGETERLPNRVYCAESSNRAPVPVRKIPRTVSRPCPGGRGRPREARARLLLTIDPHSPAEFRCNGIVRNVDAFYEAFGVGEGDALWLAPEERVTIW